MIRLIPPQVPPLNPTASPTIPPRQRPRHLGRGCRQDYRALVCRLVESARLETDGRPFPSYRVTARYPLGPWQRTPGSAWRMAWEWLAVSEEGGAA